MKLFSTALVLSLLALTACANTWSGAGADIERMGQKMQKPMVQQSGSNAQPSKNITVYPL